MKSGRVFGGYFDALVFMTSPRLAEQFMEEYIRRKTELATTGRTYV